jgi:two-component system chemotaxis sensor kinase CheA
MSMDALTNAALDNLEKNAIPKLASLIARLRAMPVENRAADDDFRSTLNEAMDLLSLIRDWSHGSTGESVAAASEVSDDSAMVADLDGLGDLATKTGEGLTTNDDLMADSGIEIAMGGDTSNDIEIASAPDTGNDIEIAMGGDTGNDIEIASAPDTGNDIEIAMGGDTGNDIEIAMGGDTEAPAGEMSDEEARALLAAMDSPATASAPSSPAKSTASDDSMSDDEARRLLAEMDSLSAANPAPDGDMSDDEARRLLAEMDSPSTATTPAAMPKAAPKAVSADDEALAMLAAAGGLDDSEPAPAPTPARAPVIKAAAEDAGHDHGGEDIGEIAEWESNDFASDPEMMSDFTTNSADIMQTLDDTVLRLEQDPTNKETIEEIFRAAHTLKGAAGMFGFRAIERVMHRMENLFDNVRKGKLVPNADTIDAVFQGLDCLKKLLAAVLAQQPSGMKTAPIVRMLELASAGKPTGASKSGASASPTPSQAAAPAAQIAHDDSGAAAGGGGGGGGTKKKSEAASTIRVDLERLDALVNLIGELVIDRTRFVNIDESLRIQAPQLKLTGSMTETLQQFGRHMNEIQDIIMKVRMVPVGSVFNKYPRIVRDLARQLGKQIDLVIEGEETEFDKTLVEQIADPLVHLIRNACDHGVETPDVRQASGKSPKGTVTLSARQEGNHIIIQIVDDGKGMDVTRIKAKGIEKGLITADQNLTDRDIFNLIFEPGFSTAEKVTTVSGRGVGMDVVKKQIAKLKGMVEIASAPGKGSTITIQLPLTLAIMQSLLVGIQEETLAIPLSSVVESIRIKPSEIQKVGDSEVIKLRNTVLPLFYLDEVLGLEAKQQDYWYHHQDQAALKETVSKRRQKRAERMYVVVVGTAERRYGLVVDALLNQQEMVIKPLGPLMRGTPCVAGGAVLGNGDVVLVMDVPEIENYYKSKRRAHAA